MKKKLLGLLIMMGLSIPAYASITVSPTKIEINANKIRNNYATCAVEVKGDAEKPMRFRAYAGYFEISENSTMELKSSKGNEHDISKKIRFVPSEFTVPAGKSQKLRVNIANIKKLPEGESRAVVFIEDVNVKEITVPNTSGIGAQLVLKTRVGVPIYVDKGKFIKKADIDSLEIVKEKDGYYTKMKIVSLGNSKVRYYGRIQIVNGKKLVSEYPIEGKAVGENNFYIAKQKIDTSKIKEAGDYTVRVIFSYTDENGNRKNIKKDAILQIKGEI